MIDTSSGQYQELSNAFGPEEEVRIRLGEVYCFLWKPGGFKAISSSTRVWRVWALKLGSGEGVA